MLHQCGLFVPYMEVVTCVGPEETELTCWLIWVYTFCIQFYTLTFGICFFVSFTLFVATCDIKKHMEMLIKLSTTSITSPHAARVYGLSCAYIDDMYYPSCFTCSSPLFTSYSKAYLTATLSCFILANTVIILLTCIHAYIVQRKMLFHSKCMCTVFFNHLYRQSIISNKFWTYSVDPGCTAHMCGLTCVFTVCRYFSED